MSHILRGTGNFILCPACNGRCCRNSDLGYRVSHMGAEFYEHTCEMCTSGEREVLPGPSEIELATVELWQSLEAHVRMVAETAPPADYEKALLNPSLEKHRALVNAIRERYNL